MDAIATIEAIEKYLDETPCGWTSRIELADLYEEAGQDDEARLQRWLAKYLRAPCCEKGLWEWWIMEQDVIWTMPHMILQHRGICSALRGPRPQGYRDSSRMVYSTRKGAEWALMQALISLGWPAHG